MTENRTASSGWWIQRGGLLLLAALAATGGASAQIPDEFSNLQVLPKDIGKRELINVMRAYTGALGGRCNLCHVGNNVDTLEDFDFASDDNERKKVARAMMKMVQEINGELLPATGRDAPTEVSCSTCHRGLSSPRSLKDVVVEAAREEGADAAVARYGELREEYYGQGAYDFSARTLNSAAEELARQGQLDAGIALIEANVEFNPETAWSHCLLGALQAQAQNKDAAVAGFERCLEIEPDNDWAKQQLARLKGS